MAELKIISMDEVQSKEVNWLWYPYIPYGKITIIQGDPGEGKTTLALRLAALLSKGEALPYDDTEREPVKIIYQTAEDGLEDTIKPKSETALSMLDERIEKAIIEVGARVVILDPIQAYVGANINMNNANEVRNVMAQLGRIAEKYDCAVLLVGHMNKGSGNKSSYRGLGSIDFQASARSVLIVGRIKDNPQVRVVVQDKSSLAPEGEAIAFELDKENGFNWLGHYDISVDDLLSGIPKEKKSEQAENLILEYLSKGKYPQKELVKKAQAVGISKRVLDEAKKALNVQSVKEGSQWYWQLPEKQSEAVQGCNIAKAGTSATLQCSFFREVTA